MKVRLLGASAAGAIVLASAAPAQEATPAQSTTTSPAPAATAAQADPAPRADPGTTPPGAAEIVVTARRLDAARASIQPNLGATSYTITNATIQALPGGDNQQFNQIVLQLPGVVQDGFGQFHVRDDHNNLQYRINGTILPEGIAVFGQTLSPRLIEKFALVTGALPAQYGLRTAGIIDITTKSGLFSNGGSISLYGGSHDMLEPSIEYGGSTGSTNYFFSGEYHRSKLGIESVDGSSTPLHDRTDQGQAFVYVDHIVDAENRVSFLGGYSNQHFEIPDPRGLSAAAEGPGFTVGTTSDFLSDDLNERQIEQTAFGQLALLHDSGPLSVQSSLFGRFSTLNYKPDVLGELLFNGQAQRAKKRDFTVGGQIDAAYRLSSAHTLRFGGVVTRDRGVSRTTTQVFPVDVDGNQTGQPVSIVDNGAKTQWTYSAYLQDEWKLLPKVTLNVGGRFDHYDGYRSQQQYSPRASLVWQPSTGTTLHAGYARYFSPPPFELVATQTVASFNGTSGGAPTTLDTTPFAEKQSYFDVGFQQKIGDTGLTLGLDGYYRRSHDLVDEGQFGAPIVLTPFNYRRGKIKGIEANASYAKGPWLLYANFAYAQAKGKDIVSSQFSFDPADLAYIQSHYIYLDHDQTYTGSAGASYAFRDGGLRGFKIGGSMIYGSGLRTDGAVANGAALPEYAQVNLSASYKIAGPGVELRLDVINVGDHRYEIRDGSGIGVGAPQFGPRRGVFAGIAKDI